MKVRELEKRLDRISRVGGEAKPGTIGELLAYLHVGLRLTPTKPGYIGPTFVIYEGEHGIRSFIESLQDHMAKHGLTVDSPLGSLWPTLTYFFWRGIVKFAIHEQDAGRPGLMDLLNRHKAEAYPIMEHCIERTWGPREVNN